MPQKSLKENAFYSVLKVFLSLVFPLITFPYASRILLPEGIGKVNFANSIISYFIMLASLGIGAYATREASKIRDDKKAFTKLFKEIITINIFCCIIAYILFFIALFVIPKFHLYHNLLLVCSIKIIFSVLGIDWVYRANEDFKYITLRSFFVQLFSLFYLFIFVKNSNDVLHYAFFGILTTVGSNVFNFIMVRKYIDTHYHPVIDIKKHLKAVIIFFGMTIVTSIYTMLDTTMLGFLSTDTEVGYYAASTKLGHMVLSMLTAITGVLLPRLTNLAQKKDIGSFKELSLKSVNILVLLSVPMTFGLIILAKPILLLLSGNNYLPAIPAMQVISPIIIVISFGNLVGVQILPALGKEKISFFSYILGASTNIIINIILIPRLGAVGAAIGTICAETVVTLIQIYFVRDFLFSKQILITLFHSLIAALIMTLFINCIIHYINLITLQLLISFLTGIIIYALILLLFRNQYFLIYCKKFSKKVIK